MEKQRQGCLTPGLSLDGQKEGVHLTRLTITTKTESSTFEAVLWPRLKPGQRTRLPNAPHCKVHPKIPGQTLLPWFLLGLLQ